MVGTTVFIIMGFYKLSPLISLDEEDSVLGEKREELIEEHLHTLNVCNGITYVGFVIS